MCRHMNNYMLHKVGTIQFASNPIIINKMYKLLEYYIK